MASRSSVVQVVVFVARRFMSAASSFVRVATQYRFDLRKRRSHLVAGATTVAVVAAGFVAPLGPSAKPAAHATEEVPISLVSWNQDGTGGGNGTSRAPSISADGRYVAFESFASNLVPGDTNGRWDIFVRDRKLGTTKRVSVSSSGTQANNDSFHPVMAADGRSVVFFSYASNLVSGDTNGIEDVFIYRMATGNVQRVSLRNNGTQTTNAGSWRPSVSGDGRYVAFESFDNSLVSGITNQRADIFVRDVIGGTTRRVSLSSSGAQGNGHSTLPVISQDGRYIAFLSEATNLIDGETVTGQQVYRHDLKAGETILISQGPSGDAADLFVSEPTGISRDGDVVSFSSDATNLVPGAEGSNVFVRDVRRQETSLVSGGLQNGWAGNLGGLSPEGRYVSFNFVHDGIPSQQSAYVFDRLRHETRLVSSDTAGNRIGGRTWPYAVSDYGLVAGFTATNNVFVHEAVFGAKVSRQWDELLGDRPHTGRVSDPVDTATGNFIQEQVDLPFPDHATDIDWRRFYNAQDPRETELGKGWTHAFATSMDPGAGGLTLTGQDGQRVRFPQVQGGGYERPGDFPGEVTAVQGGGWLLSYFDGLTERFDAVGRLVERSDWDGHVVTVTWNGSEIVAVVSSHGFSLAFTHDSAGRLTSVQSADGRTVAYAYTPEGWLETATGPDGGLTIYEHDDSGRITRIVDPDGREQVTNAYDLIGRVVEQETPGGGTVTLQYDDDAGTTSVVWQATGESVIYAHDVDGRVTAVTDPANNGVTRTFDDDGNLVAATDRRGALLQQTFDSRGNLLSRTSPDGSTEAFVHDSSNRLLSVTTADGVTSYTYTGSNRVPSVIEDPSGATTLIQVMDGHVREVTDADGVSTTFDYDAAGNLISTTDGLGRVTANEYDGTGRLRKTITPLGAETAYEYDAAGRTTSITDPVGAVTRWEYDAAGRVTEEIDPLGAETRYEYNDAGDLVRKIDPLGSETSYEYDAAGRLTREIAPGNAVTHYEYGILGRRAKVVDPTGVETRFAYDVDGNVTAVVDAADGTRSTTYDEVGRLTADTDELGRTTQYAYDHAGRVTLTTYPDGTTTENIYDAAGRVVEAVDQLGQSTLRRYTSAGRFSEGEGATGVITSFAYDDAGQLVAVTEPGNLVTTYAYDDDGRLHTVTSPGGLVTSYEYDPAGRVARVTDPAGGVTISGYSLRGEVTVRTDPSGGVQSFFYDLAGRLARVVDANGGETTIGYDARGNRTSRTNARGAIEQWDYDLADRLTREIDPLGRITEYAYDALGRLEQVTDPSGRTTSHVYDAAGQLISRTHSQAGTGSISVTFNYDLLGRRSAMADPTGQTGYTYDDAGRLIEVAGPTGTVTYTYDAAGRRLKLVYPDYTEVTYGYDPAGRLATLAHPTAGVLVYTRDADGRPTSETSPHATRTWEWHAGRLAAYSDTRGGTTRDWSLQRDLSGRVTAETRPDGVASYTYDDAGQLIDAVETRNGATTTRAYTYDAVGNRISEAVNGQTASYTYDLANQLLTRAPALGLPLTTYTYDAAGRLTEESTLLTSTSTEYDPAGRPATITARQLLLVVTSAETRTYDGDGVLQSRAYTPSTGGTTTSAFVWDTNTAIPQILTIATDGNEAAFMYGDDRAIAIPISGPAGAFLTDPFGSHISIPGTDEWVRAESYDPYGVPDGPDTSDPSFGYRGELHLADQIHLRNRDYAPSLGRFTTKDPLDGITGLSTLTNRYHYANNDPLNQVDPLGLRSCDDVYRLDRRCISLDKPSPRPSGLTLMYDLSWPLFTGTSYDASELVLRIRRRPNDYFPFMVNTATCASACWPPISLGNVLSLEGTNFAPGHVQVIGEGAFGWEFLALDDHISAGGTVSFQIYKDYPIDPDFVAMIRLYVMAQSSGRGIEGRSPKQVVEAAARLTWSIMAAAIICEQTYEGQEQYRRC